MHLGPNLSFWYIQDTFINYSVIVSKIICIKPLPNKVFISYFMQFYDQLKLQSTSSKSFTAQTVINDSKSLLFQASIGKMCIVSIE